MLSKSRVFDFHTIERYRFTFAQSRRVVVLNESAFTDTKSCIDGEALKRWRIAGEFEGLSSRWARCWARLELECLE